MLDEPTEVALAGWATDWGLPWPSTLQPNRTARWFARQIRDHALLWRRDPALPRRWLYLGIDGIAEPVSKDGAAGWSLTWRDGQPEIVWPSIAWHPLDETEGSFRERVEHYIARMNSLPGTTPTPDSFHKLDFDALALEHVAGLTVTKVHAALGADGCLAFDQRSEDSTRKRSTQLVNLLGLTPRRRRGRPPSKD